MSLPSGLESGRRRDGNCARGRNQLLRCPLAGAGIFGPDLVVEIGADSGFSAVNELRK
jgi:hypothetical protein